MHKPGHFQYTIHYEGKSFSCPRTQKGFISYYMHFSSFKKMFFLVSAILHHISLLRLLPKSYFKISTFQPNFLCSSSFNICIAFYASVGKLRWNVDVWCASLVRPEVEQRHCLVNWRRITSLHLKMQLNNHPVG